MGRSHRHREEEEEVEVVEVVEVEEEKPDRGCRPLGFLLGLPFAVCALCLSLAGGIVWVLGSMLSYVCPCLSCCADLANKAMDWIKFPIDVLRWFVDQIPC